MTGNILLLPILIPLTCAILVLLIPGRFRAFIGALTLLATAANFILTIKLFKADLNLFIPWMGSGIDISFRLFHFSAFTAI